MNYAKSTDRERAEIREIQAKCKTLITKIENTRNERDLLKGANVGLQDEVLGLHSAMRQMVPGFLAHESDFPSAGEIAEKVLDCYNDAQGVVFSGQLGLDGAVYVVRECYTSCVLAVDEYFGPSEEGILELLGTRKLQSSIVSVLRKTYQANWKRVFSEYFTRQHTENLYNNIQGVIRKTTSKYRQRLRNFILKISEIVFFLYVSDPSLTPEVQSIGQQGSFNSRIHEALDGFLRPGDLCIIVLPGVTKPNGETLVKGQVLALSTERISITDSLLF